MHAHVTEGIVDEVGVPPETFWDGEEWLDLTVLNPAVLSKAGWYVVLETEKPPNTATDGHDPVYTFDGARVVQSWQARPKNAQELAADGEMQNRASIEAALATELDELQTEFLGLTNAALNTAFNSNPARYLKIFARILRRIIRLLIRRFDGVA